MILYTTMPQELMFQQEVDFSKHNTVEINGVSLVVEQTSPSECRVVRLLSSDPNHFLNNNYLPGQMISYKPQI